MTTFAVIWIVIGVIMLLRHIMAAYYYFFIERLEAPARRQRVRCKNNNYCVTTIVTCAKEDPNVFESAMKKIRAQSGIKKHAIIIMMDAFDVPSKNDKRCLEIAKRYGDKVYITNVCDKRINLANLVRLAKENHLLYEFLAPMDSDTVCDHEWVLAELCDALRDQKVGGATTSQRCLKVNTGPERIGDWLEHARLQSSMAAGSLFGQVGCLPGRLYLVRTKLVSEHMKELPIEEWTGWFLSFKFPFFRQWRVKCKAGDDRQITNYILKQGYKTVLVSTAGVKTLVPATYTLMWKTWRRWGTSSQGYVYRTLNWLWKKPFVLYHYLSDIFITHASVFLVLGWFYSLIFGNQKLLFPLGTALLLSAGGVLATFTLRQFAHLWKCPKDFWLLPLFVVVVTLAQFVRLWAHYTPWKIGTWGTRARVDDEVSNTWVYEKK